MKEIEEFAQIAYMTRQLEEMSGGENATIAGVISDLKEKGYTIKEVTDGINSVIGVTLNKSEISMIKNATEKMTYEYEYASGTTVRYFVEVDGKDYEIVFNNGEIIVNAIATDLVGMNKLPEVTVASSNNEIIEVQKSEEGKIILTSKDKVGEVIITVTCGGQSETCIVTVELFIGLNKNNTNPEGALPTGDIEILEADASKGIVIKDKNEREWGWVEVPKTIYTTATSNTNYVKIKNDLITYAGVYRKGSANQNYNWVDEWYSGCGIANGTTYNTMYNKMLKSIYENGGFWIQRYEYGTVDITCSNAQINACGYAPDTTKTSSLLFGIQWDLVCKYLEVKTDLTTADINSDSSSWGRYFDNLLTAKSDDTKKMNIYDFAGNLFEWTLEKTTNSNYPSAFRGGVSNSKGSSYPASSRPGIAPSGVTSSLSFRTTFY